MRQGIIFGVCTILLSFILVFSFPKQEIVGDAKIVFIQDGEEIYSSPFFRDNREQYIWYINSKSEGKKVLKDEEIIEYYDLDVTKSELGDVDKIDFDKIIAKSGNDAEINMAVNKDGYVAMYEANCADKIGIKMGKIYDSSKVITCAPHKLVIKIEGVENKGAVDA